MADHPIPSESDPRPAHVPARLPAVPSPPADLPREDPRFTTYLDRVCLPLAGLAPEEWVRDLRAELGCHLASLADAYQELEVSPAEAAEHACRHLGDAGALSRHWASHWEEARQVPEPFRVTLRTAVGCIFPAALVSTAMLLNSEHAPVPLDDWLRIAGVLCVPVWAGLQAGSRSRGRIALGVAASVVLLSAVSAFLGAVLPGPDPRGFRPFLPMMQLLYWLPLGSAAAGITHWTRTRRGRKTPPALVE